MVVGEGREPRREEVPGRLTSVMTAEKVKVARQMYDSKEHTVEAIAKTLGAVRVNLFETDCSSI